MSIEDLTERLQNPNIKKFLLIEKQEDGSAGLPCRITVDPTGGTVTFEAQAGDANVVTVALQLFNNKLYLDADDENGNSTHAVLIEKVRISHD